MQHRLPIGMVLAPGLLVSLAGPAGAHEQVASSDPAAGADPAGAEIGIFTVHEP
jgi:hypothetical protein